MIVVFADLAGFSSYTERHGNRTAAATAARFALAAMQIGRRHRLRPIKTLGDAVLFVGEDAGAALSAARALIARFDGSDGCPPAHVGAHAGEVIEQDGDVFGGTVNLAAHLATAAAPGEVLVTAELARMAPDTTGFRKVSRRMRGGARLLDLYGLTNGTGTAA